MSSPINSFSSSSSSSSAWMRDEDIMSTSSGKEESMEQEGSTVAISGARKRKREEDFGIGQPSRSFISSSKEEDVKMEEDGASVSINDIPDELLGMIFFYVICGAKGDGAKGALNLRLVSARWHAVLEVEVIQRLWGRFQGGIARPALTNLFNEISSVPDDQVTYFSRFCSLSRTYIRSGFRDDPASPILSFEPALYNELQEKIDISLRVSWRSLRNKITFGGLLHPQGASPLPSTTSRSNTIRQWLLNPENRELMAGISQLTVNMTSAVYGDAPALNQFTSSDFPYTLYTLPVEMCNLVQLRELTIASHFVSAIPDEIRNLSNLTKLDLHQNHLSHLPEAISCLPQLQMLNVSVNRLTNIPDSFRSLSRLTKLDLSQNQLKQMPAAIHHMTQLQTLNVCQNELTELSDQFRNLSSLLTFQLSENRLVHLPHAICQLTQLKILEVSGNQLVSIPDEFGNLSNLAGLNLSENRFTQVPAAINSLLRLNRPNELRWFRLDLSYNLITSFPLPIEGGNQLLSLKLLWNPLIFQADEDLNISVNLSGSHVDFAEFRRQYTACANYPCRTPLALLCQQIHLGKEDAVLQETFEKLSDQTKGLIRQFFDEISAIHSISSAKSEMTDSASESSSLAEENLFANRALLVEVIRGIMKKKLEEHEDMIDDRIKQAAIREQTNERDYKRSNIIRFIDLIELATMPK